MQKRTPIIYGALLLTAVNLFLRFLSTAFQVYLSGKLGAAGMGLMQLILSVGGMATTFAMAGIRTATMYLTARQLCHRQNIPWVISGCLRYSLIAGIAVAAGVYLLSPVIAKGWIGAEQTRQAIRTVAALLPLECLYGVLAGYFTATGKIPVLAAGQVLEQLCFMAVTAGLLGHFGAVSPESACQYVVLGSGTGCFITLAVLTAVYLGEKKPRGQKIPVGKELVQTALPLALADDVRACISTTENLLVPKRLALHNGVADPLGAFGTVCAMVFPVLMLPAALVYSLVELLIPELARCQATKDQKRIRYLTGRSLGGVFFYSLAVAAVMLLLAKPLCLRLYGSQSAGRYLSCYSLLIPMLYCDSVVDGINKGLGMQRISVRYNILTAILDVVFLYLLLPKFGMNGYFFSFLVTHMLNFSLSLGLLLRTVFTQQDKNGIFSCEKF